MKIHFSGLFKATIPSILAFILMDALVEFVITSMRGVSFISFFEQTRQCRYGLRFFIFNFLLFSGEMLLVMFFHALIRPLFHSIVKPAAITALIFICFTTLFLAQLINLGIYPIQPAIIFSISMLISSPVAIFIGACVYEKDFTRLHQ